MSMRAAINAKCRDCIYDTCAPGNWRQQVQKCAVTSCPLHAYRPKSIGKANCVANLAHPQTELPPAAREAAL
jgi:hypothetical protein